MLGELAAGSGGEHGNRLRDRNHYRRVYARAEKASTQDIQTYADVQAKLGSLVVATRHSEKSWYKVGATDIPVCSAMGNTLDVRPLSKISRIVKLIEESSGENYLYVRPEDVDLARKQIDEVNDGNGN